MAAAGLDDAVNGPDDGGFVRLMESAATEAKSGGGLLVHPAFINRRREHNRAHGTSGGVDSTQKGWSPLEQRACSSRSDNQMARQGSAAEGMI